MSPGNPVTVAHALGSYPVYIEPGMLSHLESLISRHLKDRRVVMIVDTQVHQLYTAGRLSQVGWTGEALTFSPGESSKTRESWSRLTDELLERRFGRDAGIVALGGGVTGDLAGFVAATYMRGIPYLQVPTTLLAMVDASVGGKTGVNTPAGKNLVGAFYPPVAVIADPLALRTLPDPEYRNGLVEAVKHGLIADPSYFEWIEEHTQLLTERDPASLTYLVRRSVEIKAEIVSADERETGRRAILNAGHTVAHALEQTSGYRLPHGEAVALGLVVECTLAEQVKLARPGLRARVSSLLNRLGLPSRMPGSVDRAAVVHSMTGDKKNRGGSIHFALLADVGQPQRQDGWTTSVAPHSIAAALDSAL